jgi:fatty-acid desaturase
MHTAHHAFADTPKDPHVNGWKGLFTASYRTPPRAFLTNSRWFVDGKHKLLHRYGLLWMLIWQVALLLISVDVFLWAGVVPLFTLKFGDGLHRMLSHKGSKAQNRWYLEYVWPMGGEWIHDEHHDNAAKPLFANRWYEMDTGSLFIRVLRTNA